MRGIRFRSTCLILLLSLWSCGIASAYNTIHAPADYHHQPFCKSQLSLREEPAAADVLLVQTSSPWGSSANIEILSALGYSYRIADILDVPTLDLTKYKAVFIANDQDQVFYDHYAEHYDRFEQYVIQGGVLVFFTCDRGWADGNNYTDLPGHVQIGDRYRERNLVAYPHPIVTQELVDHAALFGYPGRTLTNADLVGDYCSHNFFLEDTLPPGHVVIFRTDDEDQHPTLVVYQLGNGYVVASGNAWEAAYTWWDRKIPSEMSFGRSLPDVFKYAIALAGSRKSIGVKLNVYPEDNWVEKGRPTLWKTQGDLLDIVAAITNETPSEQPGIYLNLEIDAGLVEPGFLHVYRRPSPENVAVTPDEEITVLKDNRAETDSRSIVLENLTVPRRSIQAQTQFVFRFKLRNPLAEGTPIDARLTLGGVNIDAVSRSLSEGGPATVTSGNKIILTNRALVYRQYAENGGILNPSGVSEVNRLWESLYGVAAHNGAVVYYMDKVDRDDDASRTVNVTIDWFEDRKHLAHGDSNGRYHYDKDPTTATKSEKSAINTVADKIDKILHGILERSGGVLPGTGRYVAILGGDSIIPFYRVFDDSNTTLEHKTSFRATDVTLVDAANNYVLSDIIYRDLDGVGWEDGKVEDVFVGRITGTSAENMRKLLVSSDVETSASKNAVMVESNMREGTLETYYAQSILYGYSVIRDIDGVTLDLPNSYHFPACKEGTDDPARWADFRRLFVGKATNTAGFDIMRLMCHGSVNGLFSSESWYSLFFTGSDLNWDADLISNHFAGFRPFLIFDACMVGLVDGASPSQLFNALLPLNVKGALGASGPTYCPYIFAFNDMFTLRLYDKEGSGKALGNTDKGWSAWGFEKYYKEKYTPFIKYTRYIMNLFGLPWAKITPPGDPFKDGYPASSAHPGNLSTSSSITSLAAGTVTKHNRVDTSHYSLEKSGDYDILKIDGCNSFLMDEETPVLPVAVIETEVPLNAALKGVEVTFLDPIDLGGLSLPAYRPPPPVPDPEGLFPPGGYVDCPATLGVFPAEQYSVKVVEIDGHRRVKVSILPVILDTGTRQTTLYGKVDIEVTYATPDKGLVQNFVTDKNSYPASTGILTSTTILNTSSDDAAFNVRVEIQDAGGSVVGVGEESRSIASNAVGRIPVALLAPGGEGLYKLAMVASDEHKVIGIVILDIKVISGRIESFEIPSSIRIGSYESFSFAYTNLLDTDAGSQADIYIYDSEGRLAAKLPQLTFSVLAGETKAVSTQWYPANNMPSGNYYAHLVISSYGMSFSQLSSQFGVINNAAFAYLGNNPDREQGLDSDTFEFNAEKGERVTIRLEPDPAGASVSGRVKVILKRGTRSLTWLNGDPPAEITKKLPAKAKYRIRLVEQRDSKKKPAFSGDYHVTLTSSGNAMWTLKPGPDVE